MAREKVVAELLLQHTPKELANKVFQLAHFLDQMTILQRNSHLELEQKDREIAELKTELALLKMMKGPSNETPK